MLHNRKWQITDVSELTPEELAEKLTQYDWTGCTAFLYGPVLYVNDSTSADGAQEYGVVEVFPPATHGERIEGVQFESVTFGWCTTEKATDYIRQYQDREKRNELKKSFGKMVALATHPRGETCAHCA